MRTLRQIIKSCYGNLKSPSYSFDTDKPFIYLLFFSRNAMLILTFSFFRISSSISKIKTLGSVFSFECACISYITDKHFVMRIHIFCKWYIWILGRFYPDRPSDVYLEIQYLQLVQTLFAMASSKVILYGIWYFVSQNKSFPVFRSTFVYISFFVRHNKCHFWITKKNIWRCWVYILYWRRQNYAEGKEE